MKILVQAIDKATKEGIFNLEEVANIIQSIDRVGSVLKEYSDMKEKEGAKEEAPKPQPKSNLKKK
jgi:hypothetical protein